MTLSPDPQLQNHYIVGVVGLDDGVKGISRLVGVDAKKPEQIKVGTALQAEFMTKEEGCVRKTSLGFKPR